MRLTEFGGLVRTLRMNRDLSLKEMADAMGISSAHLSGLEYGDKKLNSGHIDAAIDFLRSKGADSDDLYAVREAGSKSMDVVNVRDLDADARAMVHAFARRLQAGAPPTAEIQSWIKNNKKQ